MQLREAAEAEAIKIFGRNLHELLLAAPAGPKAVLGLDPGMRTGCKVAVVDATGKLLDTATIYPHEPRRDWQGSLATLGAHGRAARRRADRDRQRHGEPRDRQARRRADQAGRVAASPSSKLAKIVVSEAGASVYSASEFAAKEFPELDVSLRGAVSIARRLQDPLAELVKIDPKAIGVGQYQHDVNQRALARSLDATVEDCVNAVGVDVNTASAPLLARVSGLNSVAGEEHRRVPRRERRRSRTAARSARCRAWATRPSSRRRASCASSDGEQPAGPLRGAPGGLSGGRAHPRAASARASREVMGQPALLKGLSAARVHRREVRRADGARHPRRAGEARPRPAPGVQDRHLPGRRRVARRPAART